MITIALAERPGPKATLAAWAVYLGGVAARGLRRQPVGPARERLLDRVRREALATAVKSCERDGVAPRDTERFVDAFDQVVGAALAMPAEGGVLRVRLAFPDGSERVVEGRI